MPRRTQVPHQEVRNRPRTGLSPCPATISCVFRLIPVFSQLPGSSPCGPPTPLPRFGLLRVRSPLLAESLLISFPVLLRWFTSHSIAPAGYFIHLSGCTDHSVRVTPFGNPGISGHVLLPPAFRSLSRPSSPCSSKASAMDLYLRPVSNARLNASRRLHLHPINQIVSLEPSGGSSPLGSQVLRRASRLDAFSGYPFRT